MHEASRTTTPGRAGSGKHPARPALLLAANCLLTLSGMASLAGCDTKPGQSPWMQDRVKQTPRQAQPDNPQIALDRSVAWLWKQQQPDGSWRSPQYAMLRSGQAYTPFVLHTLLEILPDMRAEPEGAVARAVAFIRSQVNSDGCIGLQDRDISEYPVYATSYAIRCLVKHADPRDRPLIDRMCGWLLQQQMTSRRGFTAGHAAFGGWGFGAPGLASGEHGYMDLAHTRCALQALREAGRLTDAARDDALEFLRTVQRRHDMKAALPTLPDAEGKPQPLLADPDGGFVFSPVIITANKGRGPASDTGGIYASYASATCDGLLALMAAGVKPDDPRMRDALAWLAERRDMSRPEGIPGNDGWDSALFFYHLSVRAGIWRVPVIPPQSDSEAATVLVSSKAQIQTEQVFALLAKHQRGDGSFRNERSPLMKEDCPLLATTLATQALCGCIR